MITREEDIEQGRASEYMDYDVMTQQRRAITAFRFPGSNDDVAFPRLGACDASDVLESELDPFSVLKLQHPGLCGRTHWASQEVQTHGALQKIETGHTVENKAAECQLWFAVMFEALDPREWSHVDYFFYRAHKHPNLVELATALVSVWRLSGYDFEAVAAWCRDAEPFGPLVSSLASQALVRK